MRGFLLQLFKPVSLVYSNTTVLFAPAVVGAVANPNLLPDYGEGSSLAEQYFSLAEFINDLFRRVGFLGILPSPPPPYLLISLTLMWTDFRGSGHLWLSQWVC